MIKMKPAQTTLRKQSRRDHGSCDLDPAKLSSTLRELAMRAHHLVRAMNAPAVASDENERELGDVHAQIVRLQRDLGSHHLGGLATYVAALKERVEECLS